MTSPSHLSSSRDRDRRCGSVDRVLPSWSVRIGDLLGTGRQGVSRRAGERGSCERESPRRGRQRRRRETEMPLAGLFGMVDDRTVLDMTTTARRVTKKFTRRLAQAVHNGLGNRAGTLRSFPRIGKTFGMSHGSTLRAATLPTGFRSSRSTRNDLDVRQDRQDIKMPSDQIGGSGVRVLRGG